MLLIQIANLIVLAALVHLVGVVFESVTVLKWTSFICVRLLVWSAIALVVMSIV